MFFDDLVRIFVGIEYEDKNTAGKGHTFPLFLFEGLAVAVDNVMAFVLKLLIVRCLRRIRRTCCTGWIFSVDMMRLMNTRKKNDVRKRWVP